MNTGVKRLRIFAGPNGSGKSTLYDYLVKIHSFNPYFHINPDSIALELPVALNLSNWPFDFSQEELHEYLTHSSFQGQTLNSLKNMVYVDNKIVSLKAGNTSSISYLSAAIAGFMRRKMLESGSSYSFESVFSHSSKLCELKDAKSAGYRVYLYFIATSDPLINEERVKTRVERGGHTVPTDKIHERYYRTMNNLFDAVQLADRAFFFDNSESPKDGLFTFFAEKNNTTLHLRNSEVPNWFNQHVLQKIL